ncbi:MAG: ferrous iron transport protein B [Nitrospinae bacterium]|nr:ferrous iron transport protein B [Nitrospinota bacterium]
MNDAVQPGPKPHAKKKIVIAGLSNAGKSAIFNMFAPSYSEVSNYPHSTVQLIRDECRIGGEIYEIWDTPGVNSLHVLSGEERISRDALITGKPDVIIFTADSTRLKRSLTLFSQIAELSIPTVFALNKTDAAWKGGMAVDSEELSRSIKSPVIEIDAAKAIGLNEIEQAIKKAVPQEGVVQLPHPAVDEAVDTVIRELAGSGRGVSRGEALVFLLGGEREHKLALAEFGQRAAEVIKNASQTLRRKTPTMDLKQAVFNACSAWADRVAENVTAQRLVSAPGFAHYAGWASRHPVFGWPILLGVMWVTFQGVAIVATWIANLLHMTLFAPLTVLIETSISNQVLRDFMVGPYGIVTMGLMNAVETVVPILVVFFLIVGFLEEVGYLPNLSVLANRMFSYMGLTGKAVLSMSLGFGCNTMATMTSRMLESRKERVIAAFLIALGVPCAVQLGVMLAILATTPFSAIVLVIGTVTLTQIVCGILLNRLLKTDRVSDFILELPAFKAPDLKNIGRKTYFRVRSFLVEALPLFMGGAILIYGMDKTGLLRIVKQLSQPIVTGLLSLPDKVTEVFILVLARRELGAVYFKNMVDSGALDIRQIIVGLVVMTLFIPCVSNTMMMIKELGLKTAVYINGAIMVIAIAAGTALNALLGIF